jgi:peptidoglycan/xylan/chitin deacetylase (PgdA/CDA1 family)
MYLRRRVATAAIVLVAVALAGAVLLVPDLTQPPALSAGRAVTALLDDEGPDPVVAGSRARREQPSSTTATTTTTVAPTTVAPTTVAPTTVAPTTVAPAPTSPAGMTVGALTGGPGPIPVVHRIPTFDPVVFITIDDGVVQDPAVIEVLRSRGVPVTQFLTQQYLGDDPGYFVQVQQLGGVVGTHTRNHPHVPRLDDASQVDQICGTGADYTQIFGAAPELYRPPYGDYDARSVQIAASCGYRAVVHWSATFEAGLLSLQSGTALRPGEVILMHYKDNLAADLPILLDMVAAAGLRPAALIDYVRAAPPAPPV